MRKLTLEVCTATLSDAIAAVNGGADRLELNSALELGGLTPSPGCFLKIREHTSVPLCVLIRPRPGGFHYSGDEFRTMLSEAKWFLAHGADAIVFGFLLADGSVDGARCREFVQTVGTAKSVFHRAFDLVPEPKTALETLVQLGFQRVMTSGQQSATPAGVALIRDLVRQSANRLEILPAGGITQDNVAEIVRMTGCDQIHASLRSDRHDPSADARPLIRFGVSSSQSENHYRATSEDLVRLMRSTLDALHNSSSTL